MKWFMPTTALLSHPFSSDYSLHFWVLWFVTVEVFIEEVGNVSQYFSSCHISTVPAAMRYLGAKEDQIDEDVQFFLQFFL